jgi:hypothetical protein
MKDFWQSLTLFERFCLELWGILLKFAFIASIAGCGAIAAHDGQAAATVIVADADVQITRPEIRDDLAKEKDVGAAPVSDKLPQVQLFTTDGCPPCVEAKRWLKSSKIPWVQMPMPNPAWCSEAGRGFPAFAWQRKDGEWRYYFGFLSGADFEAYYRRSLK